jgi:hypothetical protein
MFTKCEAYLLFAAPVGKFEISRKPSWEEPEGNGFGCNLSFIIKYCDGVE